jgi:hypothetical protein
VQNDIKGAVHGFDLLAAGSEVSKAAMQSRIEFLRKIFGCSGTQATSSVEAKHEPDTGTAGGWADART